MGFGRQFATLKSPALKILPPWLLNVVNLEGSICFQIRLKVPAANISRSDEFHVIWADKNTLKVGFEGGRRTTDRGIKYH